ncbi:HNH endonuclease [Mycobacterium shigaense]|uniref:HNH endonuclease n=1 Tax=Mycobacterium shigaense TaxID=722731 RepID=A0A1Z4EIE5_9MYCO|nr:HNH endonuclease [Mycobacterium shigaense]
MSIIESMFDTAETADPSALIERIAELERVKSAAAADQARAAAALDAARCAAEAAAGIPAAQRGRGVAGEIALARRDSPARGNRHLGFAKALVHEMPHTLAALECGGLSEWRATLIVRESACLDVEDRRRLDAELCVDVTRLHGMGDARVVAAAKAIAYRLDPHAVVERAAKAESERTVSIRPAPDTMTYLTALLPMAQGVSVYAALRREADTCSDGRPGGQVMADTLVARITGRDATVPAPIAVNLVLSDETLLGGSAAPGDVSGYGPIPAAVARDGVRRRRRPTVPSDPAQALCASPLRCAGGVGIASPAVPARVGGVHRVARSTLSHPILRRADPTPRPCATLVRRRTYRRRQRSRLMRAVQLHQGVRWLAGHHRHR